MELSSIYNIIKHKFNKKIKKLIINLQWEEKIQKPRKTKHFKK